MQNDFHYGRKGSGGTTSYSSRQGKGPLRHTSSVFIPPHLEHDPLDDINGTAEKKRRQQEKEQEERAARRKARLKRRERARRKKRRRRRNKVGIICVVAALVALLLFLRFAAVPFGTVLVDGNEKMTTEDVYRAANIPSYVNVIQLSPKEMQDRLQKDLRVSEASVVREFPATIRVTMKERKAVAIVMTMYGFAYVDKTGTVIDLQPRIEGVSVPIMTGKKVDTLLLGDTITDPPLQAALAYLQNLKPEVLEHIAEVNIGNPDNIIAYTTDSLSIHLGAGDHPSERAVITGELLQEVEGSDLSVQYINTDIEAPSVMSK